MAAGVCRLSVPACLPACLPASLPASGHVGHAGPKLTGLAALSKVPAIGWVQIVFFAGIVEGAFGVGEYKTGCSA